MKQFFLFSIIIFIVLFSSFYSTFSYNLMNKNKNNFLKKSLKNLLKEEKLFKEDMNLDKKLFNDFTLKKLHYLILNNIKIYQDKNANLLKKDELEAYISILRNGNINKNLIDNDKKIIKNGNQLMKYIRYEHLQKLFLHISELSKMLKNYDEEFLYSPYLTDTVKNNTFKKNGLYKNKLIRYFIDENNELRIKLIESFLGGLLNLDPRVRLISIELLRRLVPLKGSWNFINQRIEEQKLFKEDKFKEDKENSIKLDTVNETVQKKPYYYQSLNFPSNKEFSKVVYIEILKLRRFISRSILLNLVENDENAIKNFPVEVFNLLSKPIDEESYCRIPINYFNTEEQIIALINGLENNDISIQDSVVIALIRIIRTREIDLELKLEIFKILLENESYRDKLMIGWSYKEIVAMSDEQLSKILKIYIEKSGELFSCPEDYIDQYDSKNDPDGYIAPIKSQLYGFPIIKNEYDNIFFPKEKIEKNNKKIEKKEEGLKINTIYFSG